MCKRGPYRLSIWRQLMAVCLSAMLIASPVTHQIAHAQSEPDFEIPVLTIEKNPTGRQGEDQQFIVRVTDNNAVGSVKLFYRFSANDNYTEAELSQLNDDAELYVASIEQEQITSTSIQYYLSAVDMAGNAVQRGYAFAPLTINLEQNVASDSNAESGSKKSSNRTLYTILGVVVAGALVGLAASAGGSGGADGSASTGSDGCGSAGCVLTITAPRPNR